MHSATKKSTATTRPPAPRAPSLTDQAYAIIRRKIITCELPLGLEVSEQELAHRLEMSKTPVREALARLALEGFVKSFPRRGYRITPVAVKDINDLFAVRGAIEGAAAELAAVNMPDEDIAALQELSDASYTPGETPSVEAFIQANLDFHSAIARGSGVGRLAKLVVAHLEEATRLFYMGANIRDVNPETNQDHKRIVGFLKNRSGEKARQALIQHNEHTRQGLLTSLISDPRSGLLL
ncbi:MAG: GntR family transcriptional regulator [Hyphomicrobiales bacterium]|nr:GntR family transcriptional regulator [Hyphomicrobiales bacterium]